MRNNHALLHRNDARAWLLALALGGLSLSLGAAPINRSNIGNAGITQTGRTTTLTPGAPPVNSGGSTIPISPTAGGWTQAGNYGVPTNATGPTAGVNWKGEFVQGKGGYVDKDGRSYGQDGVRYPASGSYSIPWSSVAGAAAAVVCVVGTAGACGVAGAVAAATPYIMDWMQRAGLSRNPQTGDIEQPDPMVCSSAPCYFWGSGGTFPYPTYYAACAAKPAQFKATNPSFNFALVSAILSSGTQAVCTIQRTDSSGQNPVLIQDNVVRATQRNPDPPSPNIKKTIQQIIEEMAKVNPDPRVWGETIERGGTVEMPNPSVTGPNAVQGPETVRQNADGTREVSRTTYNFNTEGNKIINTSNVTTTNIYNSSNVQTGTTTTTTTPSDNSPGMTPEPDDACKKHPEALGCQKIDFDTPDGEIPRESKDVTFQAENVLGGGSCPADVYAGMTSTGQTLKVWDWQATCNYFLPIRFILMALAAFSAVLIIMPGGGKSV